MAKLDDKTKQILSSTTFAHLATLMADGSPQVSPVWIDIEGDTILVNSAVGRVKDKNVKRDARVAISASDPQNPYSTVMIRGRVAAITTDGADAHIDKMAKKYLGQDKYPFAKPDEQRVLYKVEATSISHM